jgi:hypothetical protein
MTDYQNSAPPEDRSEGWKADPIGASDFRWWDGSNWTERVGTEKRTTPQPPPQRGKGGFWDSIRAWPTWVKVVVGVAGVLFIVAVALAPEEEETKEPDSVTMESNAEETETPAESQEAPPTPEEKLRDALSGAEGLVEDPQVKDVQIAGNSVTVTARTPEGGLEGPSTTDLNYMTSGLLKAIYGQGDFDGDATIEFTGGLIDSSTGQDLPNDLTAKFYMPAGKAGQIDWTDDDTIDYAIDWSLYRTFVHPAIKMDD